ncbi:hypothetical protein M501DRAFT_1003713 [Patellaria atrata CBS 101060]|uniref:Phosphoribosylaminoimidazole-succinocarboxamide synthase n=1 Tax=Patellaria atrata CBS 101060 TaxID=1346257 RepID=A0A9P4VT25_9PEZI|nr:hypothetical protein M501DRAFT_1003713 [Patellaria atrata CBS 101060]
MSSEDPARLSLKQTNVSRPELQHTDSRQSITASEDYFSFSEDPTTDSDDRSQLTAIRDPTPPSHYRTPQQSHEMIPSEPALPSIRGTGKRRAPIAESSSAAAAVPPFAENKRISRKPVGSRTSSPTENEAKRMAIEQRAPTVTPGVDNSPYIQFALEQLTRDEEVRGSRHYPTAASPLYPVERIIPDEGLGYINRAPPADPPPRREPDKDIDRHKHRMPANVVRKDDVLVAFNPPKDSFQYPQLRFLPTIIRPVWLILFLFLSLLMLAALIFCAIYSDTKDTDDGLWGYTSFGDGRYFVFQYLPTLIGVLFLLWLIQIQIAVQRMSVFMGISSTSETARLGAPYLKLYPTQFLFPNLQHFRRGQPLLGVFFLFSWLFNFTVPLLGGAFNIRYVRGSSSWKWVGVEGVLWVIVVFYILEVIGLILVLITVITKPSGLKWDARSLADIAVMIEKSNIINNFSGSEIMPDTSVTQERVPIGQRSAYRLGYWTARRNTRDVFYAIGEEGARPRSYDIRGNKIRDVGYEKEGTDLEAGGEIIGLRSASARRRHLPWFLRDTFVVAWIVIALVLFIALLVVSFVNNAVRDGFLPDVNAYADSDGFSPSNFLYSFLPALLGLILFLLYQPLDFAFRRLTPFARLSSPSGAAADESLLLDYPYRQPISISLAAVSAGDWRVCILSFQALINAVLPVLAGGVFWTQWYPSNTPDSNADATAATSNTSGGTTRVAAQPAAFYALCVFLALYALSLFAVAPQRKVLALPHPAMTLTDIVSWLYQSRMLTQRAFHNPATKEELVTRLMGYSPVRNVGAGKSLVTLFSPSHRRLPGVSGASTSRLNISAPIPFREKETGTSLAQRRELELKKFRFGIYEGVDGREHLGIDQMGNVRGEASRERAVRNV